MTQVELAIKAGVTSTCVAMIERGERSPTLETVSRLAWGLDLLLAELFEGV